MAHDKEIIKNEKELDPFKMTYTNPIRMLRPKLKAKRVVKQIETKNFGILEMDVMKYAGKKMMSPFQLCLESRKSLHKSTTIEIWLNLPLKERIPFIEQSFELVLFNVHKIPYLCNKSLDPKSKKAPIWNEHDINILKTAIGMPRSKPPTVDTCFTTYPPEEIGGIQIAVEVLHLLPLDDVKKWRNWYEQINGFCRWCEAMDPRVLKTLYVLIKASEKRASMMRKELELDPAYVSLQFQNEPEIDLSGPKELYLKENMRQMDDAAMDAESIITPYEDLDKAVKDTFRKKALQNEKEAREKILNFVSTLDPVRKELYLSNNKEFVKALCGDSLDLFAHKFSFPNPRFYLNYMKLTLNDELDPYKEILKEIVRKLTLHILSNGKMDIGSLSKGEKRSRSDEEGAVKRTKVSFDAVKGSPTTVVGKDQSRLQKKAQMKMWKGHM